MIIMFRTLSDSPIRIRIIRAECLSMHQPWASLLVYGFKRAEGRSLGDLASGELGTQQLP